MTDLLPLSTLVAPFEAPLPQAAPAGGAESAFLAILPAAEAAVPALLGWTFETVQVPEDAWDPELPQPDTSGPEIDPLTFWLETSLGLSAGFQAPPQPMPSQIGLPQLPAVMAAQPVAAAIHVEAPVPAGLSADAPPAEAAVLVAQPLPAEEAKAIAPAPVVQAAATPAPQTASTPQAAPTQQAAAPTQQARSARAAQTVDEVQAEGWAKPAADVATDARSVEGERPGPTETAARRPDAPLRPLPDGLPALPDPTTVEARLHRDTAAPDRLVATPAALGGPAEARPVLNQMTQALVSTTSDRTDIALSPEELGRLRLVFSGHDRSQITIWAERPETLDLVRRHADLLTQQLAEAGVQAGSLDFRQGTQRDWPQPTHSTGGAESGSDPIPGPALRPVPAPLSDRRLDIRL
nr:flagellar hook-length control protein FliK [Paracoccus saliphilus]